MDKVIQVAPLLGVIATCAAFGIARATYYRKRSPMYGPRPPRPSPQRRLPDLERRRVIEMLNEPRFADCQGAAKRTYYHLCVILDVFSRYVVGWMVAHREQTALAKKLIAHTARRRWHVDGVQGRRVSPGRFGRHEDAFAPARFRRQPV